MEERRATLLKGQVVLASDEGTVGLNIYCIEVNKFSSIHTVSLAQPDPYVGGEGLVTCYTRSCPAVACRPAPIRLQLFCVAIVTRGRNSRALSFNIARLLGW